jgi:hypothetical protein
VNWVHVLCKFRRLNIVSAMYYRHNILYSYTDIIWPFFCLHSSKWGRCIASKEERIFFLLKINEINYTAVGIFYLPIHYEVFILFLHFTTVIS